MTPETVAAVQEALRTVYPEMTFPSVESVGPKVSGELIITALIAVGASLVALLIYIWLRFEWQFSVGAVVALIHDIVPDHRGLQPAADPLRPRDHRRASDDHRLLDHDTVVIFDRLRENLIKYKQRDLREVMNLSANEDVEPDLDDEAEPRFWR